MAFFRDNCPVDENAQAWIEEGFVRLCELFPERPLSRTQVVEPTSDFFPGNFNGTREDATRFFGKLCSLLRLDGDAISLQFLDDEEPRLSLCGYQEWQENGAAGIYEHKQRPIISVADSQCADPLGLVATLAHELSHALLFSKDPSLGEEEDHEPFTDLLTVFSGFGIFTANTVVREKQWQDYQYEGWSVQRLGYLTQPMVSYALAVFAWVRGESSPTWVQHLSLGIRGPFKRGLRHLARNGSRFWESE